MQVVWYFSKAPVAPRQITLLAERTGYTVSEEIEDHPARPRTMLIITVKGSFASTRYDPKANPKETTWTNQEFWNWTVCDWTQDGDILSREQNVKLMKQLKPIGGYVIEYHAATALQLRSFLVSLLALHDGWVMLAGAWVSKTGGMINVYTRATISSMYETRLVVE